jgi:hypothetical protein
LTQVISVTCLHYGAMYLEWALRSIRDEVDACYVLYTPQGSFGHRVDVPCPETRDELRALAERGAGDKLRWFEREYTNEGHHRDHIFELAPDADVILIVDADEIWQPGLSLDVIKHFETNPDRTARIHTTHFWRSFYRGMLNDGMHAEHAYAPEHTRNDKGGIESDKRIFHYGYAQGEAITYYKQFTHGHKSEWRWNWFDEKFLPNEQQDIHPVINAIWNAEAIEPFVLGLPDWMHEHPEVNQQVIR